MSLDDQAMIDALPDAPEESATVEPVVPEDTPIEPQPVSLADDALVEVIVDGQAQRLPWKDARTSIMLHKAFTQKTQGLSEERKQFLAEREQFQQTQTQVQQQMATLQQIMQDPTKLAPLLLAQAQRQAQQTNTPQPLTTANLPDLQKQFSTLISDNVQQQFQAYRAQQQAEVYEKDIDSYTSELLKDHPVLSRLRGINDVIYAQVEKMGPKTLQEAKQYISTVVEEYRESVGGAVTDQQKQAAVAKAKGTASIEPKGGAPVVPKARKVTKLSDLDEDIKAFLDQQDRAE